ncbi:MAG: hypothetical protein Q9181_006414 [Wetmoreana brouardii]
MAQAAKPLLPDPCRCRNNSICWIHRTPQNYFHAPADNQDYSELFVAAERDDLDRLAIALKPSLDVNAFEADLFQGQTALHMAAGCNNDEIALIQAVRNAHLEAAETLLDLGANIDLQCTAEGYTALDSALRDEHIVTPKQIKVAALLLGRGLDVNAKDARSTTLIRPAASMKNFELVELLLERGASLDEAMFGARNDYDMLKFLLEKGASIIFKPENSSAITTAASGGDIKEHRLLFSHASP